MNYLALLPLAEQAKTVSINVICNSLSAHNLCALRKAMIEGDWNLESFSIRVEHSTVKSFVKECFGVTIEDKLNPGLTRMFRTANESVELFSYDVFLQPLFHFEGNFLTTIEYDGITFEKNNTYWKFEDKDKVKMNHLYAPKPKNTNDGFW